MVHGKLSFGGISGVSSMAFVGSPEPKFVFQDNHSDFNKELQPVFTTLLSIAIQRFSLGEQEPEIVESGLEPGTQYWG